MYDIDAIKEKLDIITVAEHLGIDVARRGDSLCPRHNGRSLRFFQATNSWSCFGCQAGGSAIDLIMFVLGYDLDAAIAEAGQLAGVEPTGITPEVAEARAKRKHAYELYGMALEFFQGQYQGSPAQDYAKHRGIDLEAAGLGYAPDSWSSLFNHLGDQGVLVEDMIEAGLLKRGKSGEPYDLLRHRLIIPVYSNGQVVYLQGRALDGGKCTGVKAGEKAIKYVNVSLDEPPVYAVPQQRTSGASIAVTESTTDALQFAAHSVPALATFGAALKDHQLASLKRYDMLYVAAHNDAAGQRYAQQLAMLFGDKVLIMPPAAPAKDWDEALRAGQSWDTTQAQSWVKFYLSGQSVPEIQAVLQSQLKPLIAYHQANQNGMSIQGTIEAAKQHYGWSGTMKQMFAKQLKEAIKTKTEQKKTGGTTQPKAPAEPDSATWPYDHSHNSIVFCRHSDTGGILKTVVADFYTTIAEEISSEDGQRTFLLAGVTTADKPFTLEISAENFASDQKLRAALTEAAGAIAPVRAGMVKHLAPAIQLLSSVGDVQRTTRYSRTGWLDDNQFLIEGRMREGQQMALLSKLPYSIGSGDVSTALAQLDALTQAKPTELSTVVLSYLFGAPMALGAGLRNERYGMFIAGRSGNLKSSWSQAAMSLYGRGFLRDDLLIKFGEGATRNAIMAMAAHAHDMPMLVDNYKPNTGNGHRDFINLVHTMVEGGEKDRLNRTAELRDAKPVFTWPLFTGEDVPDTDPASLARVLVVPFAEATDDEKAKLATVQLDSQLSVLGGLWLDWLESEDGQKAMATAKGLLNQYRAEWATYLKSVRNDLVNVLRLATSLAANALTWLVLQEHPVLGEYASRYAKQHLDGLRNVAKLMANYTAETLEASRYIVALRELLASEKAILIDVYHAGNFDFERMIGYRDHEAKVIYLVPSVARQFVDRLLGAGGLNGMSENTLYSQLNSQGYIAATDTKGGKTTKMKKINGVAKRLLWIYEDVLLPETEDQSDED